MARTGRHGAAGVRGGLRGELRAVARGHRQRRIARRLARRGRFRPGHDRDLAAVAGLAAAARSSEVALLLPDGGGVWRLEPGLTAHLHTLAPRQAKVAWELSAALVGAEPEMVRAGVEGLVRVLSGDQPIPASPDVVAQAQVALYRLVGELGEGRADPGEVTRTVQEQLDALLTSAGEVG